MLNIKDITYENGKLMFECVNAELDTQVFFAEHIPKGSSTREVRQKIYQLIAMMMEKEEG